VPNGVKFHFASVPSVDAGTKEKANRKQQKQNKTINKKTTKKRRKTTHKTEMQCRCEE